jgi:hypothetical protein
VTVIPEYIRIQKDNDILVIDYELTITEEDSHARGTFKLSSNVSKKKIEKLVQILSDAEELPLSDSDIRYIRELCEKGKITYKQSPKPARKE